MKGFFLICLYLVGIIIYRKSYCADFCPAIRRRSRLPHRNVTAAMGMSKRIVWNISNLNQNRPNRPRMAPKPRWNPSCSGWRWSSTHWCQVLPIKWTATPMESGRGRWRCRTPGAVDASQAHGTDVRFLALGHELSEIGYLKDEKEKIEERNISSNFKDLPFRASWENFSCTLARCHLKEFESEHPQSTPTYRLPICIQSLLLEHQHPCQICMPSRSPAQRHRWSLRRCSGWPDAQMPDGRSSSLLCRHRRERLSSSTFECDRRRGSLWECLRMRQFAFWSKMRHPSRRRRLPTNEPSLCLKLL